ncbi:BON domain-containing protein [Streptomyces sp. PRKS01-65]|nr:BON domain-containing protein [Streptomyces harenosi]NEY34082.1 BON domain-containing protein [Streptomyces harenosi]
MNDPTTHGASAPAGSEPAAGNVDYRIAHLRDRLAAEELGELGVRAEVRAGAVAVTGTVPSAQCRETLLRIVHEELAGLTVHSDIVVAETTRPDHAEEL